MTNVKLRIVCLVIVVIAFSFTRSVAQTHFLTGKVTDAGTREPLYNASVYNKTEHRGIRTDSAGRFRIPIPAGSGKYTLVITMVGYTPRTLSGIAPDRDTLTIALPPEPQKMAEVFVTNKREGRYRNKGNPAVELILEVIAHKDENRPESFGQVSYEEYDKLEISLRDVDSNLLKKRLFRPYKFLFEQPD